MIIISILSKKLQFRLILVGICQTIDITPGQRCCIFRPQYFFNQNCLNQIRQSLYFAVILQKLILPLNLQKDIPWHFIHQEHFLQLFKIVGQCAAFSLIIYDLLKYLKLSSVIGFDDSLKLFIEAILITIFKFSEDVLRVFLFLERLEFCREHLVLNIITSGVLNIYVDQYKKNILEIFGRLQIMLCILWLRNISLLFMIKTVNQICMESQILQYQQLFSQSYLYNKQMNSANLSIQDYKKWKINQLFRPYIGQRQKYAQMKKYITCFEAAEAWEKYSSEEQKKRILQGFKEIERLHKIKDSDKIILDLEALLRIKANQIRGLADWIPLKNLTDLMIQKQGPITDQELTLTTYKTETIKLIKAKLLESSQYKSWCEKSKKLNGSCKGQQMDIQQQRIRANSQSSNLMEEQIEQNFLKTHFGRVENGQVAKMPQDVLQRVKLSIRNKIKSLTQRYFQKQILDIQIFKIMERLLSNHHERVELIQIQCLLLEHNQFRDCIKRYFQQIQDGFELTLEGEIGYQTLNKIYMLLMPINVFQLQERWMQSQFKKSIKKAVFIVGNTGVGKSTFIQCLLGYEQKRQKTVGGEISLQSKTKLKPEHAGLIASSYFESVTTNLSAFTCNFSANTVQLIDTPGFQDSKGALVDIANQITLENAYQACGENCFLFLIEIGKFLPERGTFIREFAQSLAHRFEYQTLEELESFVLIIFNNKNNTVSQMNIHTISQIYISQIAIEQDFLKQEYFKNRIALSLIQKSVSSKGNYFDPMSEGSINSIKERINLYNFHGKHRMKSNFSDNTKNSIQLTCNLLKKYIKQNALRNQITKVRFYYEQIHLLSQRIPNSISTSKEEVDLLLQDKSQKIYDEIYIYLHLKLKNIVYEQKQFTKIAGQVSQLESLNELTEVNPRIKSVKEIQKMMTDVANKYGQLVNQQVKESQIQKITLYISLFSSQYNKYLPTFLSQIELKCFNKLVQLQKDIHLNFKNQQMKGFDASLKKYQTYQLFYKAFLTQNEEVFNRKNSIIQRQNILAQKLDYLAKISTEITQLVLSVTKSFKSNEISITESIITLDNLYNQYKVHENSQALNLKDSILKKKHYIISEISKQFESVYQIFTQFFIKFEDNEVCKQEIKILLLKMDEANSSTSIQQLKKIYLTSKLKITQKYVETIKYFQIKVQQININLKENKKLPKDYSFFHLKDKIQMTLFFSYLTEITNLDKISKGLKLFKELIENLNERIMEIIEDRELSEIKQVDFIECLNKTVLFQNYSIVSLQTQNKLLGLKDQIIRKIEKFHTNFENALILKKFKTFQQLKRSFNKSLLLEIQQYLNKVYFPSKKIGLLVREDTVKHVVVIYKEISRIFLDIEGIIKLDESVRFPSTIKEQVNNLTREDLKKLFAELENYVEQICHIYYTLHTFFTSNKILMEYLSQGAEFHNGKIEDINLSELQKEIKQFFDSKTKDIQSYIVRSSSLKSNLEILSCIKKECEILRRLQIRLKNQNEDMEIDRIILLDKIVQSIIQRLNEIQDKHFSKVDKVIDYQNGKIKNPFEAGKIYVQLRQNSQRQVSLKSRENFKDYLEKLDNCIQSKNRQIKRQYRYYSIQSEISNDFLLELQDFIDLHHQFQSIITPEDESVYNVKIIMKLQQIINFMIEKIEGAINQYKLEIQKQFQRGKSDEAKKKILRMQTFIKVIKRFESRSHKQNKVTAENEQQSISYSQLISEFKEKIISQQARGQQFLKKQLDIKNIEFLNTIYENFSDHNKFILKRKIRVFFEQQLIKYKESSLKEYQQRSNELQEALQKIPTKILQQYKWRFRLQEINRCKKTEQEEYIAEIKSMKTETILERKQILNKFLLIANKKARNEVLKKISEFLSDYEQKILKYDNLADKLNLMQEQSWIYEQIKPNQIDFVDISNIIKKRQKTTVNHLIQTMSQNCKYILNFLDNKHKQYSVLDRDSSIGEIYLLQKIIKKNMNKFILKDQFQAIITICQQFQNTITNNFLQYCPINSYNSEKDQKKKIKLLAKIYQKFEIYQHIMKQKQKNQIGTRDQSKMIIQNYQQQIIVNEEAQISIYSIYRQIDNFKFDIDNEIEKDKEILKNFNFIDSQIVKSLNQKLIQLNINELSSSLTKLQNISQVFNEISKENTSINILIIKDIKTNLNRKLQSLINRIMTDFKHTIHDLNEQISKQFIYLQLLVQVIGDKKLNFLNIEQQTLNSKFIELQPREQIKQIVYSKIVQLGGDLTEQRTKIEHFFKVEQKELKSKLDELQQMQSTDISYLMDQKQQNEQRIRQQNDGKEEHELDLLYAEARNTYRSQVQSCKLKYLDQTKRIQEQIQSKSALVLKGYCQYLITLKRLQMALQILIQQRRQCAQIIKNEFKELTKLKIAKDLSKALSTFQQCDEYVHILKNSSQLFQFESIEQFNEKTKAQDINYVINQLKTKYYQTYMQEISMDVNQILQKYHRFQGYFLHKTSSYYKKQKTVQNIIDDWSKSDEIQQLATILSVWSIQKSIVDADSQTIFKLEPHPVQVVILIILLTRQQPSKSILSKLGEVKTGQGKSIILATLATFYAKLGYRVNVACYSDYLCRRDFKEFTFLFQAFEVQELIYYGTFNQICELALRNNRGSLKEIIYKFLTENLNEQPSFGQALVNGVKKGFQSIKNNVNSLFRRSDRNSILLVDEVDVFFEKDYFGELYRPVVRLDKQQFIDLIVFVWKLVQKNKFVQAKQIYNSLQFKKCIQTYPKVQKILRNQIHGMLSAILSQKVNNKYQVHQRAIKYRDKDKLSSSLHFGYETIFANCREFEAGRISEANYINSLFIPIIIGEFSYSELPKQYDIIQGLSGTIGKLPKSKDMVLQQKYNIGLENVYLMPTIYSSQTTIDMICHLSSDAQFYGQISQKIYTEIQKSRPVLVCFQNYVQLKRFQQSFQFKNFELSYSYLHQMLNDQLRDKAINGAGTKRKLTLMTSQFSRGTDVIIRDRFVTKNGGLALIMAYIPKSQSQFEQFKGRTGRQGNNGSIDIFFNRDLFAECLKQLKGTLIKDIDIPTSQEEVIQKLKEYWSELDQQQMKQKKKQIQQASQKHLKTLSFMDQIDKSEKQIQFLGYLEILNTFVVRQKKIFNILIGIDGTCSMRQAFRQLKSMLAEILKRINELKKQIQSENEFQLQIAVYRNYSSGQRIFESSTKEKQAQKLIKFLDGLTIDGGQGFEGIQILYKFINVENDIDMLLLIGDSPPNTPKDIVMNRNNNNWKMYQKQQKFDSDFFDVKSSEDQMAKFSESFVIHGLALKTTDSESERTCNKQFERYLANITSKFHGTSQTLDLKSKNAADILTQFITTKITSLISGAKDQNVIRQMYGKMYKSYT